MVQQISNQLTTGTSTPALVAQALSGNTILKQLFYLLPLLDDLASIFKEHSDAALTSKRLLLFYHQDTKFSIVEEEQRAYLLKGT